MAEIIESGKKSSKRSTRVDLTPMVGLGFLLITFFIFTTAMSKPTGLKIFLPKSVPENERIKISRSGVLTILLGKDNRYYYYEGDDPHLIHWASEKEIREVILEKKKRTIPIKYMVIIKPSRDANFHALVNIMDEMTINGIKHYALVDIEPIEYSLMKKQ